MASHGSSSADLLLSLAAATTQPSSTTQISPPTSPAASHPPPALPTVLPNDVYYIEYRARELIDILNTRNWAAAEQYRAYCAPDFAGRFMYAPADRGFDAHVATFRRTMTLLPRLRIEILETNVHVDEAGGRAECFMLTQGRGGIPGIKMNAMSHARCRKEGGEWVCYKHVLSSGVVDMV